MTFIQFGFFLFLIAGVILFYICPVKHRWKMLLVISILFYAIAGVKYLPFIFVTSFSVFLAGLKMGRIYEEQEVKLGAEGLSRKEQKAIKESDKKRCKKVLIGILVLNIGILSVVKFTRFFVDPINDLIRFMGGDGSFSAAYIIVPLGISYYTFTSLSYLLDIYWKHEVYEKNYFRFLLYVIYFPHILQGPIERYGRLGHRLKEELRFDYDRVASGVQLMLWGYFKKLVIADRIDILISGAYEGYQDTAGVILILAMFLDVVYIYADFSGCMDMARGISAIFGVELDLNFNHPFSSKSVTEFWRRWHMSLGSWFKDYVYYPISTSNLVKNISKSARGKLSPRLTRSIVTVIPVSVTWVLTGVWHGTGKTYVAWGVYYAFMIFMSVTFEEDFGKLAKFLKINTKAASWKWFQMIRTTCIFAGGRLLTRPGSLRASWNIFKQALTSMKPWAFWDGSLYNYGLDRVDITLALICILIFGFVSHLQLRGSVREMVAEQNLLFRWGLWLLLIFTVLILGIFGLEFDAASFVYMAY